MQGMRRFKRGTAYTSDAQKIASGLSQEDNNVVTPKSHIKIDICQMDNPVVVARIAGSLQGIPEAPISP